MLNLTQVKIEIAGSQLICSEQVQVQETRRG